MTTLVVKKTERLEGVVKAPSSKAYTHRAIIAASLSEGKSVIVNPLKCNDTEATIKACSILGAKINWNAEESSLTVEGFSKPKAPGDIINCRGSGSTIRFLTPICALAEGISILTGNSSLKKRPMQPLLDALNKIGARCLSVGSNGRPPIIVLGGRIKGGRTWLAGNISSQFISGLLFAAPKAETDTVIVVGTPLESKFYVEMTLETLKKHGIEVKSSQSHDEFIVYSGQNFKPTKHVIEGDYSSAAFLLAAAGITNSKVKVEGLKSQTLQGDRAVVNILEEMGVPISLKKDCIEIYGNGGELNPIEADLRDSPDLVPVCVALACFAEGKSIIRGVRRLRFKESDRLSTLFSEFSKMGAKISVSSDFIAIEGKAKLYGAELCPHRDHRIAMACAVAALRAEGETVIHGIERVRKSYPNFVDDLKVLGGDMIGW